MKLVILDRDGTLNHEPADYLHTADDWVALPGALEAVASLNHAGYSVVVAANLPSLGRGLYDMTLLNAIQERMNKALAALGGRVEALFFCPHAPDAGCDCRKPKAGLFRQIGARYGIDLTGVPMVGDSHRDMQAAVAAGCQPHLVLTGEYAGAGRRAAAFKRPPELPEGTQVHDDLAAFARDWLAGQAQREEAAREARDARDARDTLAPR